MNSEKDERADQKERHSPEREEENGVFVAIMVRCVCQIAGELPV